LQGYKPNNGTEWDKSKVHNNRRIIINGKFLSQRTTGVQRFAREVLLELDRIASGDTEIILAADKRMREPPAFRKIQLRKIGRFSGNLWEQLSLPMFVIKNGGICVNLCNMAPILTPHIVVIHDVSYKVNKRFFSRSFAAWYNLVFALITRRIKRIITVSKFSKGEILREYPKVDPRKITVACNGWQHFKCQKQGEGLLRKYGLSAGNYYFSMSSMAKNKNFKWIAKAAALNPGMVFAVSGAVNEKVFGETFDFTMPGNLNFLGYVNDDDAAELMKFCKAFIFPSFYEGFGIPPLEALSVGAKVIVSDTGCMREIFEDAVYYIDPRNPDVDLDKLLLMSVSGAEKILNKFSWRKSAEILYDKIKSLLEEK